MDLPTPPTVLPQARRYTRRFETPLNKFYRQDETITINIPPIAHTYLTKDVKLHFDLDLSYVEATEDDYSEIAGALLGADQTAIQKNLDYVWNFFGKVHPDSDMTPPEQVMVESYRDCNIPNHVYPSFDINGAQGLFSRLQVYDYLGTTLLEDIDGYDVLTATLTDYLDKDDPERPLRPYDLHCRKDNGKAMSIVDPFYYGLKPLDPEHIGYNEVLRAGDPILSWTVTPRVQAIPKLHCAIDLYSLLGKLSSKFVPLHNGFTIKLQVNQAKRAINLCTIWESNQVRFLRVDNLMVDSVTLHPEIRSMELSRVYLRANLLELTPEFDGQVAPVLHFKAFKYQLDRVPIDDKTIARRIHSEVKSATKIFIGQRINAEMHPDIAHLSFRIKNGFQKSALLIDRAVVDDLNNDYEAWDNAKHLFGSGLDPTLRIHDFLTDCVSVENLDLGAGGFRMTPALWEQIREMKDANVAWWLDEFNMMDTVNSPLCLARSSDYLGRFLIAYDLELPGTTPLAVTGLDLTKRHVEYQLERVILPPRWNVLIDVFTEFDAFLNIKPSETTAVSF